MSDANALIETNAPPCLHCGQDARLTDGREIYPNRPDLAKKKIWKCDACDATVGCHGNTDEPLGYPANRETRRARMLLHNEMLDPLWKLAPKRLRKGNQARNAVYDYLARELGLPREETHTAMWDVETCRSAWRALAGMTITEIIGLVED